MSSCGAFVGAVLVAGGGAWGRRTAYQNTAHTDGDGLGRRRRGRAAVLREPLEREADVRGVCGEEGHEATDEADALDDELALRHLCGAMVHNARPRRRRMPPRGKLPRASSCAYDTQEIGTRHGCRTA